VTINGLEEAKNNGEAQIIDLLEGKIFQTQESVIENMNTMFWADGLGNGGKDWNGLHLIVAKPNTTLGDINPATAGNSFWSSTEVNQAGALTTAGMASIYNTISVGNDQPTIIITTQALYEKYEGLLEGQIRYTDTDVADGGFQNLLFKGAPVTFDNAATAGQMMFLNTKYLQLVAHSDVWFKPTPFVRPTNQDAVFSQLLCYGQLTCSNRARQGYMFGAT
jgi:hypothetical protein